MINSSVSSISSFVALFIKLTRGSSRMILVSESKACQKFRAGSTSSTRKSARSMASRPRIRSIPPYPCFLLVDQLNYGHNQARKVRRTRTRLSSAKAAACLAHHSLHSQLNHAVPPLHHLCPLLPRRLCLGPADQAGADGAAAAVLRHRSVQGRARNFDS